MEALFARLAKQDTSLVTLSLYFDPLEAEGLAKLIDALASNTVLRQLTLVCCRLDSAALCDLAKLAPRSALQSISIQDAAINDDVASAFAQALRGGSALTSLELLDASVTDQGASALASCLGGNHTLRHLNLRGSKMTDAGLRAFASALQTNKGLTSLDVGRCRAAFSDDAMDALAEGLQRNNTLSTLRLDVFDSTIEALLHRNRTQVEWSIRRHPTFGAGCQDVLATLLMGLRRIGAPRLDPYLVEYTFESLRRCDFAGDEGVEAYEQDNGAASTLAPAVVHVQAAYATTAGGRGVPQWAGPQSFGRGRKLQHRLARRSTAELSLDSLSLSGPCDGDVCAPTAYPLAAGAAGGREGGHERTADGLLERALAPSLVRVVVG